MPVTTNFKMIKKEIFKVTRLCSPPAVEHFSRRLKMSICGSLGERPRRPCLDLSKLKVVKGLPCHDSFIKSFLHNHYWPREPSLSAAWMPCDSEYICILTEKYIFGGDKTLVFEETERTKEQRLVGLMVANRIFPWSSAELEEWAHYTECPPERNRMYLIAHCINEANLFKKYNAKYIYDIEVLGTAPDVAGHGVAKLMLRSLFNDAKQLQYPVIQLIALSSYAARAAQGVFMKKEWSMNYADFVDQAGKPAFYPRGPHQQVSVFSKTFNPCFSECPRQPGDPDYGKR